MRHLLLLLLLLLVHGASLSQPTIDVPSDDVRMVAAIEGARRTVRHVLHELERGNPQTSVKVRIVDGDAVEHFWLREVAYDRGRQAFVGKIDNDPQVVHTVKLGQVVSVKLDSISDWLFMRGDKMHGNFTARAMLSRMPPEEARRLQERLSEDVPQE